MIYEVTYQPKKRTQVKPITYHVDAGTSEDAILKAELRFIIEHRIAYYESLPDVEELNLIN